MLILYIYYKLISFSFLLLLFSFDGCARYDYIRCTYSEYKSIEVKEKKNVMRRTWYMYTSE